MSELGLRYRYKKRWSYIADKRTNSNLYDRIFWQLERHIKIFDAIRRRPSLSFLLATTVRYLADFPQNEHFFRGFDFLFCLRLLACPYPFDPASMVQLSVACM